MAVVKTVEIKANLGQSTQNIQNLNEQLEIQRQVLIDLDKELLKVEETRKRTAKTDIAAQTQLREKSEQLRAEIKAEKLGLRELNSEKRIAVTESKSYADESVNTSKIVAGLDKLTGGYATKIIKLYKGFKESSKALGGFIGGLSKMQKALLATGIGALVVALGLVVAYWDEIKEFISGTNKELQNQENVLNNQIEVQRTQLGLLKQQKKLEELRTGSNEKTTEEYKKQLIVLRELQVKGLENLQTQLELVESKNKEVTLWEKTKIFAEGIINPASVASNLIKAQNKSSEKSLEIQEKLNKAKSELGNIDIELAQIESNENKKRQDRIKKEQDQTEKDKQDKIKAEKEKADAIERIRQGLIDTEEERRKEELRKIQADYEEQIKLAEQYYGKESLMILALKQAQTDALNEQEAKFKEEDRLKAEAASKKAAEKLALDKENDLLSFEEQRSILAQREALLLADKTINEKDRTELEKTYSDKRKEIDKLEADSKKHQPQRTEDGLNQLSDIAGESTVAGKGFAVASATLNTYRGVSDALAAETLTPFETALKFVNAAAILTNGLRNVKKIVSVKIPNAKGGGGTGGASSPSGGAISQPPAFNVVGQGGTNQLAQAIGQQEQQPVQAYVVANDVTSAQSLQRNIQTEAGLG